MNGEPVLVRALLGIYPARWRRRYGEEFAALLGDVLGTARWYTRVALIADVATGALDARLHPLTGGRSMSDRIRGAISMAVCATAVFGVAGIGFQKMTEDPALAAVRRHHAGVTWSFAILVIASMIAAAAAAAAALPAALALLRGRPRGLGRLIAVPPVAAGVWLAVTLILTRTVGHRPVHSAANVAAGLTVFGLGFVVVAAGAWAVVVLLRRAEAAEPARARPRVAAMTVLSAGMAVATAACLGWGLALRAADPAEFHSHNGILATPLPPTWIATFLTMAGATALACAATRRATTDRAPAGHGASPTL